MKGLWQAFVRLALYAPPLWAGVILQLLVFQVGIVAAHSDAIVKCEQNIKYSQAVKVGEDLIVDSTGLYAEHYDTNGDGKFDIVALSQTDLADKGHRRNPVFWIVDLDLDGAPDAIYIDKVGKGRCEDIVLYEDLNAPTSNFDLPQDIDKGRKL